MPDFLKVIILGIVEGLTEFLPISSTGHLIVAASALDFGQSLGGTFEIFIQLGAVIAVIAYYRAELTQQARTVFTDAGTRQLWLAVAIAFVPAAVIGVLFIDKIKELLFNPTTVAISLIVGGIVFLVVENRNVVARTQTTEITRITIRQAVGIGVAQIASLIPGVSRSGASIIGGMLTGLDRSTATQFSFFLAIPTLGIATLYDLVKNFSQIQSGDLVNLLLGAVVSGIMAWFSIGWLLRFVSRNSFVVFGYYRIIAGVIILLLVASNVLVS
ncbi:MAG: undecaprenyl-diphosphate phosphatase [Anaerolineae bacterium]|nr:undecaprenyl-diphosphate phosphatase [Anaerolineae bacterium]